MAQPGAHDFPPTPDQLAQRNLEPFGPDAVVEKLEQFAGRYRPSQLEVKEHDHPFDAWDGRGGAAMMAVVKALLEVRVEGRRLQVYERSLLAWASDSDENPPIQPMLGTVGERVALSGFFEYTGAEPPGPEEAQAIAAADEAALRRADAEGQRDQAADLAAQARGRLTEAMTRFIAIYSLPAGE